MPIQWWRVVTAITRMHRLLWLESCFPCFVCHRSESCVKAPDPFRPVFLFFVHLSTVSTEYIVKRRVVRNCLNFSWSNTLETTTNRHLFRIELPWPCHPPPGIGPYRNACGAMPIRRARGPQLSLSPSDLQQRVIRGTLLVKYLGKKYKLNKKATECEIVPLHYAK